MEANPPAFKPAAVHVFVQFFRPRDESRRQEIETCLRKNIANRHIDCLHVWVEEADEIPEVPASERVKVMPISRRITYADWLAATNALPPGDISLLLNADIFLDETVELLRAQALRLQEQKLFLAITRYNLAGSQWLLNANPQWTQDSWGIVRGKEAFSTALLQEASVMLGVPGCDNKIAYLMHSYGFAVSNPCRALLTRHLHAQKSRDYDKVEDRLLGLYAFVEPVSTIGSPSSLEFHLLTRAPRDPQQITVANWFNQRVDQVLLSTEGQTALTQGRLAWGASYRDIQRADPRFVPQVSREYASPPGEATLVVLEKYSSRYSCLRDETHLYFVDAGWPLSARIHAADLPSEFVSWPMHRRFAFGFLPPLFDLTPFKPSAIPDPTGAGMFWQYPCRTEQMAAEIVAGQSGYLSTEEGYEVYLGLPWATFYDRTLMQPSPSPNSISTPAEIELLAARLQGLKHYLSTQGRSLRIHTVCQHIDWAKCLDWFIALGVTDLWISHKQGGQDWAKGIRLHPWHLYAVNVLDHGRQQGLFYKPVEQRALLASFIGAHMPHYLSDIRLRLAEAFAANDVRITVNDQWHFNRVVYEGQAIGANANQNETEAVAMRVYNRVLSDSRFSLCPVGAGPNTVRLWESLAIGSIPVILSDTHELPALELIAPELDLTWDEVLLRYPEARISRLEAHLRAIPAETIVRMQRAGGCLFEAVQQFSPVGVKSKSGATEESVCWFKPQQLHPIAGRPAGVTGLSTRFPAWLADDAAELTIHFDKPEEVLAVRVVRTGDETVPVRLSLGLARAYGQFVDAFEISVASGAHWVEIQRPRAGLPLLTTSVRLRRSRNAKDVLLRIEFKVRRDALAEGLRKADSVGALQEVWETPALRALAPFDAQHAENGDIFAILRRRSARRDSTSVRPLFASVRIPEKNFLGERVCEGLSLVVPLMNRNAQVTRNLQNWLDQPINELILVDWSSDSPVAELPGVMQDPRVRIIHIPGQTRFYRTWVANLGIRCARYSRIMKCDADVTLHGDFFEAHPLFANHFWSGEWRQAREQNERHLNGNIYFCRDDFYRVNGYDERILSYGHEDSELALRLIFAGGRKQVFSFDMMHHQPHANSLRIGCSEGFIHPEVATRYQRLLAAARLPWSPALGSCFRPSEIKGSGQHYEIRIESDFTPHHEPVLLFRAKQTVASWYANGVDVERLSEVEIDAILASQQG